MKANKTSRGQEASNHRRRKDKLSESSPDSITHNQILKQQQKNKWQESPHAYQY
jgi:hypothetical protein